MKPIAIFQHHPGEGPGYFLQFARQHQLPVRIYCSFLNEPLPATSRDYAGLVFMGGPMSVNDDLPWLHHEIRLIQEAMELDTPVLGHCLGAQLLAKAMGAHISANQPAACEIGWHPVHPTHTQASQEWFGDTLGVEFMHWHSENFSIPERAVRLLSNEHCHNQAFASGKHLGMQFHLEMTEAMVQQWSEQQEELTRWQHLPSVQNREQLLHRHTSRVAAINRVADHVYGRWIQGLAH